MAVHICMNIVAYFIRNENIKSDLQSGFVCQRSCYQNRSLHVHDFEVKNLDSECFLCCSTLLYLRAIPERNVTWLDGDVI